MVLRVESHTSIPQATNHGTTANLQKVFVFSQCNLQRKEIQLSFKHFWVLQVKNVK